MIKPSISASGRNTAPFPPDDPAALALIEHILPTSAALVQPIVDLGVDGERSLVFIDGAFSHSIVKRPAPGGFLVQVQHGGTSGPTDPSDAELSVATRALVATGRTDLLYARVDLVGSRSAPLLMELELIEPQLFLDDYPESAATLANAIVTRLS